MHIWYQLHVLWWPSIILQYLKGLGYLCQKAETTWSHVLLMSVLLQKYLTILPLLLCRKARSPNPEAPYCVYTKQGKLGCWRHPKSGTVLQNWHSENQTNKQKTMFTNYICTLKLLHCALTHTVHIKVHNISPLSYKCVDLLNIWRLRNLPYHLDHTIYSTVIALLTVSLGTLGHSIYCCITMSRSE